MWFGASASKKIGARTKFFRQDQRFPRNLIDPFGQQSKGSASGGMRKALPFVCA
jgi:hypothetical protein